MCTDFRSLNNLRDSKALCTLHWLGQKLHTFIRINAILDRSKRQSQLSSYMIQYQYQWHLLFYFGSPYHNPQLMHCHCRLTGISHSSRDQIRTIDDNQDRHAWNKALEYCQGIRMDHACYIKVLETLTYITCHQQLTMRTDILLIDWLGRYSWHQEILALALDPLVEDRKVISYQLLHTITVSHLQTCEKTFSQKTLSGHLLMTNSSTGTALERTWWRDDCIELLGHGIKDTTEMKATAISSNVQALAGITNGYGGS